MAIVRDKAAQESLVNDPDMREAADKEFAARQEFFASKGRYKGADSDDDVSEAQRMTVDDLAALVQASFDGNPAMRGLYPADPQGIAAFMAQELVRVRAAERDGDVLVVPQRGGT